MSTFTIPSGAELPLQIFIINWCYMPWSLAKIDLLVAELRGTVWNIDFYLGNQIFYWTSTVTLYSCTLQPITLIFCIQTTLAMGFLCCKFHTHCFICLAATGVGIIFHLSPTFFVFLWVVFMTIGYMYLGDGGYQFSF